MLAATAIPELLGVFQGREDSSGTASFPAFKEQAESKRLSFFSATEGSTVPVQYVTCTASQSREKLWDVDAATSITRTRKEVFERFDKVQLRPHVFAAPPRTYVLVAVPSVVVVKAEVQETPPFQESCTHILGEPVVLPARASKRTSIPLTVEPAGTVIP